MSTAQYIERNHGRTSDQTRSGVLHGAEEAKTSGHLLLLSLPQTSPQASALQKINASWVETFFEVFHTKLTMHDVIPENTSAPHSIHYNPPKPHGVAARGEVAAHWI